MNINHWGNMGIKSGLVNLLIIISVLFCSGCMATNRALVKIDPPVKMVSYNSIYLLKDNLLFDINVRYDTGEKDTWCASIPFEKVKKNSSPTYKVGPNSSIYNEEKEADSYYKSMNPLSSKTFEIYHSSCSQFGAQPFNEIPHQKKYEFGRISFAANHPEPPAPISFYSDSIEYNTEMYIIYKSDMQDEKWRITKIVHPLPFKIYDHNKLALLPIYVAVDIVTFPLQAIIYTFVYIGLASHSW